MADLAQLVEEGAQAIVESGAAPGVTVAITSADETLVAAAAGVRKVGLQDAIEVTDPMHVGSCTKAMTATLVATAIDSGLLSWTEPIGRVLPDVVHPKRSEVTLVDLLAHRAAVAPYEEEDQIARLPAFSVDPRRQRAELAALVLEEEPDTPVGEFSYSNAGFAVAASIWETATDTDWESGLIGMLARAGIRIDLGWPASDGRPAPWGHELTDGVLTPHDPHDGFDLSGWIATAGDVSISAPEMMKWARLNLAGLGGSSLVLQPETWNEIHTPHGRAGLGWGIQEIAGQPASVHSGSAGTFSTLAVLLHHSRIGIVINANAGDDSCEEAEVQLLREIVAAVA